MQPESSIHPRPAEVHHPATVPVLDVPLALTDYDRVA